MARGKLFGALIAGGLTLIAVAAPAGARTPRPPKPVITAFSSSSTSLGKSGGPATLTGSVLNASSCTFSSSKPVTGLPATVSCSGGTATTSATFPANSGTKAVVYKITLIASGSGRAKKKKLDVTVTTQPPYGGFSSVSCSDATDCTAVGGVGVAISDTETSGTWGPEEQIPSGTIQNAAFISVSCSDATDCTAVGAGTVDGTSEPIYAAMSSGTWGSATQIPGSSGASFNSVSCSAATDCTAVGGLTSVTETNGSWGPDTQIQGASTATFYRVSCPDVTDCTAVGWGLVSGSNEPFYASMSGGTWGSATEIPDGTGDELTGVSCSSAGNCTAVGGLNVTPGGTLTTTETNGSWGPFTEIPGSAIHNVSDNTTLTSVSCPDATDCTTVGLGTSSGNFQFFYAELSNGTWGSATEIPGGAGGELVEVSCSSAGNCTAVGYGSIFYSGYPEAVTETNGIWGPVRTFTG